MYKQMKAMINNQVMNRAPSLIYKAYFGNLYLMTAAEAGKCCKMVELQMGDLETKERVIHESMLNAEEQGRLMRKTESQIFIKVIT